MPQKVLIVESPAKAKTINKYLGDDYNVIASFGHIRDLPTKDGSVRPDQDFAMEWELSERADKPVSEIVKLAQKADSVYLASDPDREGEAIAWHVKEVLKEKGLAETLPIHRVTFNEITKSAVLSAITHPREIDQSLVDAYMARRALDYLVGFSLSPILWRKLRGSKSAGRVQSVALRLICEREAEIESFHSNEYWTIKGTFITPNDGEITGTLTHFEGQKLDKFSITSQQQADKIKKILANLSYQASKIERKQVKRNPYAPFTTSTLQQEASRRLGLGATRTMRVAQQLYEGTDIAGETVGLITYMRTDAVSLSQEAIRQIRGVIEHDYGDDYLPREPRVYQSTAKNAQEAHEAIRPTDAGRTPSLVAPYLSTDELRLYTLIWQRAVASQMASAVLNQVSVEIAEDIQAIFRATGSTVVFDGWLRIYQENKDEDASDSALGSEESIIPPLQEKDVLNQKNIVPEQHFTQPPPRYSEASLVRKLEELGIGRPSTYASIMQVLQDRSYVRLDKKRFIPEDLGRIVTAFLEKFFSTYVQYDFTADLEEKLDNITNGSIAWKNVMRDFWSSFSKAVEETTDLKVSEVIDALDEALGPHFFPIHEDGVDPRKCTQCADGRMGLKLGKFGAFIGCSNYPTCKNTAALTAHTSEAAVSDTNHLAGPRDLGVDPATNLPVTIKMGPYGPYAQLGPATTVSSEPAQEEETPTKGSKKKKKAPAEKPKRVSLPKGMDPNTIDLTTAIKLLSLPREIGKHPETGEMITATIGRYGPYLQMGALSRSLPDTDDLLTIGLNRAVVLFAEPSKARKRPSATAKNLGDHPKDSKPITLNSGRFGPYVKWGRTMATVTKAYDPESLTLEQAVEIIETKLAKVAVPKAKASKKPKGSKKTEAETKSASASKPKTSKTKAKKSS